MEKRGTVVQGGSQMFRLFGAPVMGKIQLDVLQEQAGNVQDVDGK